jgi:hypothetical protein
MAWHALPRLTVLCAAWTGCLGSQKQTSPHSFVVDGYNQWLHMATAYVWHISHWQLAASLARLTTLLKPAADKPLGHHFACPKMLSNASRTTKHEQQTESPKHGGSMACMSLKRYKLLHKPTRRLPLLQLHVRHCQNHNAPGKLPLSCKDRLDPSIRVYVCVTVMAVRTQILLHTYDCYETAMPQKAASNRWCTNHVQGANNPARAL